MSNECVIGKKVSCSNQTKKSPSPFTWVVNKVTNASQSGKKDFFSHEFLLRYFCNQTLVSPDNPLRLSRTPPKSLSPAPLPPKYGRNYQMRFFTPHRLNLPHLSAITGRAERAAWRTPLGTTPIKKNAGTDTWHPDEFIDVKYFG